MIADAEVIMSKEISFWEGPKGVAIPKDTEIQDVILYYSKQLTEREQQQTLVAYRAGFYEMSTEYLWHRSIKILRDKLINGFGVEFLKEMINISDGAFIQNLPDYFVIKLAYEVGFINKEGNIKLSTSLDFINHYASRDSEEEMDKYSADLIISSCIKYIIGKEESTLNSNYALIRDKIKGDFANEDNDFFGLSDWPYFYKRTTLRSFINLLKTAQGADLNHVKDNFAVLVPRMWDDLLEEDKYALGTSFAEAKSANLGYVSTIDNVLTKIKGYDYVPENLRSNTFVQIANELVTAHFSMNNYYKEPEIISKLESLGTVIPSPALPACIKAIMLVKVGNRYGFSWGAQPYADKALKQLSKDKWSYVLDKVLFNSDEFLNALSNDNPFRRWIDIYEMYNLKDAKINDLFVKSLFEAFNKKDKSMFVNILSRRAK